MKKNYKYLRNERKNYKYLGVKGELSEVHDAPDMTDAIQLTAKLN